MSEAKSIEQFNLRSKLRFNIESGNIWLDEGRMLLVHAKALGALRKELFDTLGNKRAQALLIRMGYVSGQQDADLALKLYEGGQNFDVFRIGPELHAFQGLVNSSITEYQIDWEKGCFYGEVDMLNSWEAESHKQSFGLEDELACWTLVGYASGYVSRFFKRFIVFRELQCTCSGHDKCIMVGKPAEEWDDEDYVANFRSEDQQEPLREMEAELAQLPGKLKIDSQQGELVGQSPAFNTAFDLLSKAANSLINVLLLGETGVGKEVFARWLHDNSERADKPFVAINCAAIPNDLIEAELFGVKRGAYTGATESRPGRFERADGGTLLLDEVGDLSLSAQVKLLRVLQNGEIERLGDDQVRKVNVRLIAATNVDLQKAITEGRFRADLYYRLATYPVDIPSLRDRKCDIPLLVSSLLEKFEPTYQKNIQGVTDHALEILTEYNWQGNVRELENLIERGVLLAPANGLIEAEHIFSAEILATVTSSTVDQRGIVANLSDENQKQVCEKLLDEDFDLNKHESQLLDLAVQRAEGNLTHAARLLNITRRQLAYRLRRNTDCSNDKN